MVERGRDSAEGQVLPCRGGSSLELTRATSCGCRPYARASSRGCVRPAGQTE